MCETQLLNVGGKAAMRAEISRKTGDNDNANL